MNEDLSFSGSIDLDSIVGSIASRYESKKHYTWVGSDVLIAITPSQDVDPKESLFYAQTADRKWKSHEASDAIVTAHLLELSSAAFANMINTQKDQGIVLRGVSGSGKSNARKQIVRQLVALSTNAKKNSKVLTGAIKMQSVLQAFGNAKTSTSENSSRFSLYSEYQFSRYGRMVGIKTLDYSLEKNRISDLHSFAEGDRNFNIFYQVIHGLSSEERSRLFLEAEPSAYVYLQSGKRKGTLSRNRFGTFSRSVSSSSVNDVENMKELSEHLKSIGIGKRIQAYIFQVIAAILHIGNIQFSIDPNAADEPIIIKNTDALSHACACLGITESALQTTFQYRTKLIGKNLCSVILTLEEALNRRDDLARILYSHLFSWILARINDRLCKEEEAVDNFIGVLDFSNLSRSEERLSPLSFHELCINLSHERITQYMDTRLISSKISSFKLEQLNPPEIRFSDNASLMTFLTGSNGLTSAINEETCIHQDPELICIALNSRFSKNPLYVPSSGCSTFENHFVFGIRHSAAKVEYSVNDFATKNLETISPDYIVLFRSNSADPTGGMEQSPLSTTAFISSLFSSQTGIETEVQGGHVVSAHVNSTLKRNPSLKRKPVTEKKALTVKETAMYNHLNAIDDLMVCLANTKLFNVLCINPFERNAKRIKVSILREQIEQFSVPAIAACRVFANVVVPGFPYDSFQAQFGALISKYQNNSRDISSALSSLSKQLRWRANEMILGRTQIFLSDSKFKWFKSQSESLEIKDADSEHGYNEDDAASEFGSEADDVARKRETIIKNPSILPTNKTETISSVSNVSGKRKAWVCITWALTWWIFTPFLICCGKMKRPDIRMAWREKVSLCIIIFFMNISLLFIIIGLRYIICPPLNIKSTVEVAGQPNWVSAQGRYYDFYQIKKFHLSFLSPEKNQNIAEYFIQSFEGLDVSNLFYKQDAFSRYCQLDRPQNPKWDYLDSTKRRAEKIEAHRFNNSDGSSIQVISKLNNFVLGYIGWSKESLPPGYRYIFNNVYDTSTASELLGDISLLKDITVQNCTGEYLALLRKEGDTARKVLNCLNNFYFVGVLDTRNTLSCVLSNYLLLVASILIASVIVFKFLAALRFSPTEEPEESEKFVVLMVPCYTEGQDSLSKTLESLAILNYDDKRKLLFIVCDGMIVGAGNDRPTPRIVLDILGVDPSVDPEPQSFNSLGEGNRQFNMAKVYSGLYEVRGHSVPFVVVVKVGGPSERTKPGNRGKRDSQLVLMRFFNRVHFNSGLSPMEITLYHHMKNVIGVNPTFYEFVLMVDADTEVQYDSLNRMISNMVNDGRIIGLCGETQISNDKTTWVTMIQVYEYFISHHLSKAFESLFGTVTCLPGCFCMYRIRSAVKNMPLLVSNEVLREYAENNVDTLHLKNLLHLGEDRYLTTLVLKHFPQMKTCFINDARCSTSAPESWAVLLSQRRRWINSTIHNLFELTTLGQLCGFCCFSMRFVVMIDLLATFIQPAAVLYIGYLIYAVSTSTEQFPLISIIVIAAVYGLQIIIFLIKGEWQHIIWMIFYILALPLFSFWIPLYSFWHFDDFSWGNTRVVVGEGKKTIYIPDSEPFDPSSIPLKTWREHEESQNNSWEVASVTSASTSSFGNITKETSMPTAISPNNRISMFSSSSVVMNRNMPAPSPQTPVTKGSDFPSDDEIWAELREILATADLMTLTKKQAREALSIKFGGVDLKSKREYINKMIDVILKGG